jgi:cytochrome c peroxidase
LLAEDPPPDPTAELRETATALLGAVSATPEGEAGTPLARLGRALFWDTRLSANGEVACASCHYREGWSSDTRAKSTDARGRQTGRHSQPVFHAMETSGLRWLADRPSGTAWAEGSITGSMGFAGSADNHSDRQAWGRDQVPTALLKVAGPTPRRDDPRRDE